MKETRKTFKFYTFDADDKKVVITVKAKNEDRAWDIFEKKYPLYYVDQVIEQEND